MVGKRDCCEVDGLNCVKLYGRDLIKEGNEFLFK